MLPDETVRKYNLSFAAANFSRNLIRGGGFDRVFSLIPVNVSGPIDQDVDIEEGYEVVYSDWRRKGGLLRKIAVLKEQWSVFRRIGRKDSVWFYNLNMLNGFLYLLLMLLKPSVSRNIILLDFTPPVSRKEQNYWFLKLINTSNGVISLSPTDIVKIPNIRLLPGVVPTGAPGHPVVEKPTMDFLLSGVISNTIAMTETVLKAFSMMPECVLHISGRILEGEDVIKDYAARFDNIIYHGPLGYNSYLDLLHKCTFQLSTRNPAMPENACNFPSKIIEALLHNRIVVSTIHYPQLEGIAYMEIGDDSESLRRGLKEIAERPESELLLFANQSGEVTRRFNSDVWFEVMSEIESHYSNSHKV
ncbi:MAG: hypothetical protein K2H14_06120 [Muribaculaceae bacterium]|nr:hypothetical protein [Muribaculaceae bacterium]